MSEWRTGQVSDFAQINPKDPPLPEDAPFIAMADVDEWGVWARPSGARGHRNGARAQGGDVLMARITPCLENGKIARVPGELDAVGGSTEFIVLRPVEEAFGGFLFLWAQSFPTHQRAVSLMTGTTGRQRVSAADVAAMPMRVPPVDEQRRIVDVMTFVDSEVAALDDEVRKLRTAFSCRKEDAFQQLPNSGKKVRLGDVLKEVKRPIDVSPSEPYRQIGIRSFGRGVFIKEPVSGVDLGSKRVFWVKPGDLVFNIVFAWEGAVALVPEGLDGYCGSHRFPTYRRADGGEIEFFRYYFTTAAGVATLGDCSPGGAGRNRTLNRKRLANETVFLPDPTTQKDLVSEFHSWEESLGRLELELIRFRSFRASLLTALVAQQIDMPESYDTLLEAVS